MGTKRFKYLRRYLDNRMAHGDTIEQVGEMIAVKYGVPVGAKVTVEPDDYVIFRFDWEEK